MICKVPPKNKSSNISLGFVGRGVLEYLQEQKRYGCRPLTSKEIIFKFWGVISDRAVLDQICRLEKAGLLKKIKVSYKKNKNFYLYEAVN